MGDNLKTYLCLAFLVLLALAIRIPRLTERPMHGDEANQAVRAGILYDTGVYEYDPFEHHGPTLYYFSLPFLWLSGADNFTDSSEYPYRLEIVFFGIGIIFLLFLIRDAIGLHAVFWAGLLTAISPLMVYYSRYFIQESLLAFFAFAAIAGGWRYLQKPHWAWALFVGLNLGLVHATKETSVLIFASMGIAVGLCFALAAFRQELKIKDLLDRKYLRHATIVLLSAIGTSFVLYTAFFTHWRGPLDSILTYGTYLNRAEGHGSAGLHDKPWYYYLEMLLYSHREAGPIWSEAFAVIPSVIGCLYSFYLVKARQSKISSVENNNNCFRLFLTVYFTLLLVSFSIIPYKTPWNALAFYQPLILLSGIGISCLLGLAKDTKLKIIILIPMLFGVAHLARLSSFTNFTYAADTRNPYVYAQTSTALFRLVERLDDLAVASGEGKALPIHIVKADGDYWPLPWYLRAYKNVGYWPVLPETLPEAEVFITDTQEAPNLAGKLGGDFIVENHGLRPNMRLVCFIHKDLWNKFMADRR